MFIVRFKNFQTTPPWFGLSPFLYLSLRDFGCGKAMSFDDLFRKDRPNKMLQITPNCLVAAFTRNGPQPCKCDCSISGIVCLSLYVLIGFGLLFIRPRERSHA